MSVPASLRFKAAHPCPVCRGYDGMGRGQQQRCHGFLSPDGAYCHCSREELAGSIPLTAGSQTYAHILEGPCACGVSHGERPALSIVSSVREPRPEITATYDYLTATGDLLFQVVRTDPKGFYQRRPATLADAPDKIRTDADGKHWVNSVAGMTLVPYHLPELLAAPRGHGVLVLEGEKDVAAARAMGFIATCNPMGAGKWQESYNQYFRDRVVVVVADKDAPEKGEVGQKHARHIVEQLRPVAADVTYLELPEHDFSDWAAIEGNDKKAFQALVRSAKIAEAAHRSQFKSWSLKDLLTKKFPPVLWAVPDLIPQGLTLFAGDPKSGKSLLMLQICLGVACGGFVLGSIGVKQGEILYADLENGEEILQERAMQALGTVAAPADFHYVTEAPGLTDGLLELIESWKLAHPRTRLIVLDTFEAIRPPESASKGTNAYRADYAALRPLADLAKRLRIGIVVVHHLSKSGNRSYTSVDDIFAHFNGSYGLNGAVDNLMALGNDGGKTVLCSRGRRGRPVKKALNWDMQTAQWTDGGDPAEARQSDTRRLILAVLADADEPLWPSAITARTGLKSEIVRQHLYKMVRGGEIVLDGQKYTLGPNTRNSHNAHNAPEDNGVTDDYEPPITDNGQPPGPPYERYGTHDPPITPSHQSSVMPVMGVTAAHNDTPLPDPFLGDSWLEHDDPGGF